MPVADASHEHVEDHLAIVDVTLREIGAEAVPSMLVLNKSDRRDAGQRLEELQQAHPGALAVSALRRSGLDELKERISFALRDRYANR